MAIDLLNQGIFMGRRRKGAVRVGRGSMCNICAKNCGKGGGLKKHVEAAHGIKYDLYKKCFYGANTIIANAWDDSVSTTSGKKAIVHVLVRRFVDYLGPRGVTRSAHHK